MSKEIIVVASSKSSKRVDCLNSTSVPAAVAGDTIAEGSGVWNVSGHLYPLTSGHVGIPNRVCVVPGRSSSGSYDLTVYGANRTSGDQGADGPWLWTPLFKCTVAATLAHTGAQVTDVIETSEYLAATITATAGGSGDARVTSYGGTVGPAHFTVPLDGSPYLLFVASVADAFVLTKGQS